MFEKLIDAIESAVASGGYPAIVALMALGCACIPIPSEVVMIFAGIMVRKASLDFHSAALLGVFGCVIGSVIAYWVGLKGGRAFLEKYGKYVLIKQKEIDHADKWFARYGQSAVFFGRMVPVIRSFISLPAGIYHMNFLPFLLLSFIGSIPWCYGLLYLGYQFQEHLGKISQYFHIFDYVIIAVLVVMAVWWVVKKRRESRQAN